MAFLPGICVDAFAGDGQVVVVELDAREGRDVEAMGGNGQLPIPRNRSSIRVASPLPWIGCIARPGRRGRSRGGDAGRPGANRVVGNEPGVSTTTAIDAVGVSPSKMLDLSW